MYWYLRNKEESPLAQIRLFAEMEYSGKFAKLPPEEGVKITKQLLAWENARGRNIYDPNEKESLWFLQPHFIRAISAGNRAGKTCTCTIDVVATCEGWHPLQRENLEILVKEAREEWVRKHCQMILDKKLWIHSPPIRARCVAPDFSYYVEKIIGVEYEKWATRAEVKEFAYAQDHKRYIKWKNGSVIEFMTSEQQLKVHGGSSRHIVQIDEEIPYDYWIENQMRVLDVEGRMIYGATAVEGVSWSEEEIFVPAEKGSDDIFFIEMSTYDNPVISDEAVNKVLALCRTQADKDIRIFGKRIRRGGTVYDMAKDELPWIIPKFDIPKDEGVLIIGIDTHPKVEHAVLFIWIDYKGDIDVGHGYRTFKLINGEPNLYEVAEIFINADLPLLVHKIREMEKTLGRKHDFAVLEPAAWNTDQFKPEEKVIAEQMQDLGILAFRGSKKKRGGIEYVKSFLSIQDFVNNTVLEHPRLMTFDKMERITPEKNGIMIERTRWERVNYHYPHRTGKLGENMKIVEDPVDKDDHMMENERRIVEFFFDRNYELLELKDKIRYYGTDGREVDVNFEDEEEDDFSIYKEEE